MTFDFDIRPGLVVPTVLLGGLFAYQLFVYLYNVFLHPLAKYPGPRFCAASNFPFAVRLLLGDSTDWTLDNHTKYGEVVRLAPNELSYASADAYKDIHGHRKAGQPNLLKHPDFYVAPGQGGSHDIIFSDDATHSRMRRIFANAFSDRSLKLQEPLFMEHVNKLVRKLSEAIQQDPNRKIDMVKMYNFTTFDVMGDLTFGEPLHLLDGGKYSKWVENMFGGLVFGAVLRFIRYYPILFQIGMALLSVSGIKEKMAEHNSHSSERVDKRLAKTSAKPDIWNLVIKRDDETGLSRQEMYSNASLFMIAGTETTATLLSGLTYYLLRNPEQLKKLTDEIRSAFSTDADITIEGIAQLKYVQACVEEGLRMYPPVAGGLPRIVPQGGVNISGEYVPADSVVYVSHWSVYRNPRNFHDPNSFIPERWIGDGFDADKRDSLQPFSYGPRNCLGKNMAYHEMRLILVKTLWHFDLTLCPESANWSKQRTFSLWEKHPLMCTLTPVSR